MGQKSTEITVAHYVCNQISQGRLNSPVTYAMPKHLSPISKIFPREGFYFTQSCSQIIMALPIVSYKHNKEGTIKKKRASIEYYAVFLTKLIKSTNEFVIGTWYYSGMTKGNYREPCFNSVSVYTSIYIPSAYISHVLDLSNLLLAGRFLLSQVSCNGSWSTTREHLTLYSFSD